MWLYSLVCVEHGWKTQTQVFSFQGQMEATSDGTDIIRCGLKSVRLDSFLVDNSNIFVSGKVKTLFQISINLVYFFE